jgi:hypothetical protein
MSSVQHPLYAGYGIAAEPDLTVIELNSDQAVAAEAAALAGNIRALACPERR